MTTLFGHSVRSDLFLLCIADALICAATVGILLIWQGGMPVAQGMPLAVATALACSVVSGAAGLYRPEALGRTRRLLVGTLVAGTLLMLFLWLPVVAMLGPLAGEGLRNQLIGVTLAFLGAVITTRLGFSVATRRGAMHPRVAVLRAPGAAEPHRIGALVRDGVLPAIVEIDRDLALRELVTPERLALARIDAFVVADGHVLPDGIRQRAAAAGIAIFDETEFLERRLARVDIERLPQGWAARSNAARGGGGEAALRRAFDILLGSVLVIATLPLLVVTAAAIKLDSPGPVFYRQERVGRGGRVFMLFKFRSMRVDAETGGKAVWASKADPRVTRIGRLLRLTRIDEIPQVLNVLRGDMAFVGPRPERPAFVADLGRLIPHYNDRALVKPGITGWAQVNYPYGASVEDARMKLAYDLYYIRRRSLFLDLLILIATVRVVLFQEGSR